MVVNVTKTDPNAKDPLIGQRVGASYVITEPIGSGGMGTVYAAESAALGGQKIAVKVLMTKSSEAIARFRTEAFAAGKVNDQFSVVGLIDTGALQTGQHYIALQYCDGGSLEALLRARTKPLPFDDIISFISPICAALVRAHASGLVHRDLKPANILFVKDGEVFRARLADFGIVKLREHARLLLTAPKTIMGTPGYMSPEQWMDTGQVDSRADIYSIGCVLYELVTGRLPYIGTANEMMHQTKHNAPVMPPSALRSDTPQMWNSTIMRCLSHRREDRIQTILEVIHTLADAIDNGRAKMGFFAPSLITYLATGPTANTVSQAAGGAAGTLWSEAHSPRKSPSRRPWPLLVAGIAMGTVTTGAVALMIRSTGVEPAAASTSPTPTRAVSVPSVPPIARTISPIEAARVDAPAHRVAEPPASSEPATASSTSAPATMVHVAPNSASVNTAKADPASDVAQPPSERGSDGRLRPHDSAKVQDAAKVRDAAKPQDPAKVEDTAKPQDGTKPQDAAKVQGPKKTPTATKMPDARPSATTREQDGVIAVSVKQTWAQVWIDGVYQESTPVRATVPVGTHKVLLVSDGHRETVTVNVQAGGVSVVTRDW